MHKKSIYNFTSGLQKKKKVIILQFNYLLAYSFGRGERGVDTIDFPHEVLLIRPTCSCVRNG